MNEIKSLEGCYDWHPLSVKYDLDDCLQINVTCLLYFDAEIGNILVLTGIYIFGFIDHSKTCIRFKSICAMENLSNFYMNFYSFLGLLYKSGSLTLVNSLQGFHGICVWFFWECFPFSYLCVYFLIQSTPNMC